jgi:hypothetical protein
MEVMVCGMVRLGNHKSIRGGNTWSGTVTTKRVHSKDTKEISKKFSAKQRMINWEACRRRQS